MNANVLTMFHTALFASAPVLVTLVDPLQARTESAGHMFLGKWKALANKYCMSAGTTEEAQ